MAKATWCIRIRVTENSCELWFRGLCHNLRSTLKWLETHSVKRFTSKGHSVRGTLSEHQEASVMNTDAASEGALSVADLSHHSMDDSKIMYAVYGFKIYCKNCGRSPLTILVCISPEAAPETKTPGLEELIWEWQEMLATGNRWCVSRGHIQGWRMKLSKGMLGT